MKSMVGRYSCMAYSKTHQVRKMIKLLVFSFLLLAISHGVPTAEGDVSFDLSSATPESYTKFISDLRNALPFSQKVYGLPVLYPNISESRRFILLHLTSYAYENITAAIDVTSVYIVAYSNGNAAYFFEQASPEALRSLFKDIKKRVTLPFTGNYESLQTAAHKIRENIDLGLPALSNAISTLFYYNVQSAASACLVLIQTTSESARFRYIELKVAKSVATNFKPDQAIISLENNWSALSKQILIAKSQDGRFQNPVELVKPNGERFQVTNVDSEVVKSNIKLLLHSKASTEGRDENVVAMLSNNCGSEMKVKLIDNGRENYVVV